MVNSEINLLKKNWDFQKVVKNFLKDKIKKKKQTHLPISILILWYPTYLL
jgi:hypothetical protein